MIRFSLPLSSPKRLLAMMATFVTLAIGVLLIFDARHEYQHHLAALKESLEAETKLLAEHAQLSMAAADMILAEVGEDIRSQGLDTLAADRAYWQSLRKMLERTPQLTSLTVADAQGRVRMTSVLFPSPEANISDRGYFDAHALGGSHHIGEPIFGRASERWLIPVSIRLSDSSGEFQGLIMASLDIAYFQGFYSSLREDKTMRLGMFRRDGTLLALAPALSLSLSADSRDDVAKAFAHDRTRTWLNDSPVDGDRKLTSYRHLNGYPLVVTAAYDYSALLAELYPAYVRNGIIFVMFAAVMLLSMTLVSRAMRTAEQAREAELQIARLCQAIANHLPNGRVSVFDHDLRIVFADGRLFREHHTISPDQVQGKTIWEVYSPELCAKLEPLGRVTLAGHEEEAEIAFEEKTLKVNTAPIKDASGRVINGLALTHDITELKQAQRALEALSTTDSLLGIANRREFDRVLEREWQRGRRTQRSLSLLMIDVDCFKQYNDAYGHPQGDASLQQIAAVLGEIVSRPEDLVARYGGEELAVLLPSTDLQGAVHVAQQIHELLAHHNIPFTDSPVALHVTVSIGVASIVPDPKSESSILIAKADEALYAAKRNGRNRTEPCPKVPNGGAYQSISSPYTD